MFSSIDSKNALSEPLGIEYYPDEKPAKKVVVEGKREIVQRHFASGQHRHSDEEEGNK